MAAHFILYVNRCGEWHRYLPARDSMSGINEFKLFTIQELTYFVEKQNERKLCVVSRNLALAVKIEGKTPPPEKQFEMVDGYPAIKASTHESIVVFPTGDVTLKIEAKYDQCPDTTSCEGDWEDVANELYNMCLPNQGIKTVYHCHCLGDITDPELRGKAYEFVVDWH